MNLENFSSWLKENISTPNTYNTYLSGVSKFVKEIGDVEQYTPEELRHRANTYIAEKPTAYYRKFALKYLFMYLGMESEYHKLGSVSQPPRKVKKKDIDFRQIKKLVKSTNNILLKLLIMLQYDTGARVGALLRVQMRDIGQDDDGEHYVSIHEKGGVLRTVYFSEETKNLIYRAINLYGLHEGYQLLFEHYFQLAKIDPYSRTYNETKIDFDKLYGNNYYKVYSKVWYDLKEHSRKTIGIDVTSHYFRHSRIIHLLKKGYTILEIQRLTGHSNLDSLRRYIEEAGLSSKEVMQKEAPSW